LALKDLDKTFLEDKTFRFGIDPFSYLKVIPKEGIEKLRVMICRPDDHKWEPLDMEVSSKVEFLFIDFFEWDRYSYVSYPYFQVKIARYDKNPNVVGWNALVETINGMVFFSPSVPSS